MFEYWNEFLALTVVQVLAVASPGPDFAIIMRQSLVKGRKEAYWAALGIAVGASTHATYCVLGLGVLITKSILLFNVLKYAGAAYLVYLGIKGLRAKPREESSLVNQPLVLGEGAWTSFRIGLITNLLNPKCTLFVLSLFSVVISPETPLLVQSFYALWIGITSVVWFMILASIVGSSAVRGFFQRCTHFIERATGAVLIALGTKIAISD